MTNLYENILNVSLDNIDGLRFKSATKLKRTPLFFPFCINAFWWNRFDVKVIQPDLICQQTIAVACDV